MTNNKKLMILLRGIIMENPVLILVLGTCPTLAVTKSMFQAFSMGLAATAVLVGSNVVISALRKIIPDTVRIPCYIVVIAAFVTAVQMLLEAFLLPVYTILGSWLALIVVNCIVLGRAEAFASKNGVIASAVDGLCQGIGYTVALVIMCVIREFLGAGTFGGGLLNGGQGIRILPEGVAAMHVVMPVGGFLVLGFVIAGSQYLMKTMETKRKDKEAAK